MGFETIVRPVVFPNIRPTPKQSVPTTTDDPDKDLCVITGSSGRSIDLPYSWSTNSSESRPVERKRRFDRARVYQEKDDGTVNEDNYVDINVANKIWSKDGRETKINYYKPVKERKNIAIIERNKVEVNKPEIADFS